MADITVDAFGAKGVNVDTNPLLLDDAELQNSQNAFHDTSNAKGGGIRTRWGFRPFHATNLGGQILGGLGLAVAGVATATGAGGGPGTGGTGAGAGGGPGSTIPPPGGGGPGGGGVAATGPYTPSGPGFLGSGRLIALGRMTNAGNQHGNSWFLNTAHMADNATILTATGAPAPGPPNSSNSTDFGTHGFTNGIETSPKGVKHGDWFYYSGGITSEAAANTQRPALFKTDGLTDSKAVTFPLNPFNILLGAANQASINFVISALGYIWASDLKGDSTGNHTRLLRYNPDSGELITANMNINVAGATGASDFTETLVSAAPFMDKLFVGNWAYQSASGSGNSGASIHVFYNGSVPPGYTGTSDLGYIRTEASFPLPHVGISCMANYNGQLFAGTASKASGANTAFARVYVRDTQAPGASSGWTVSLTSTGNGEAVQNENWFTSMVVFHGALYAAAYNPGATGDSSVIYKYDGTSWTKAFGSTTAAQRKPLALIVDLDPNNPSRDTIYGIGMGVVSATSPNFIHSQDGAAWADRTTFMSGGTASLPIATLFGFEQA